MPLHKNITVFPNLFIEERVKKLYDSFEYFNKKVINKEPDIEYENIYSFKLVPEYFELNRRNHKYKTKKIPQYNWGYSILLNDVNSIEGYLQQQFSSKKRSIIKRYVNRLESCFNIRYKLYHGDLSQENYFFIMESLKNMIIERFRELNDTHKNMKEWDFLLSSTYEKIINKTASLFVIYNDEEPIEISLNYHYDKILFSYVSSYSIDYSKFGLGHVEIFKQVEWCKRNDYILFEMGVGGTDYKRRWSNNIYRYYQYIVYSDNSTFFGIYNTLKYRLKEYLKSKKPEKILGCLKNQSAAINSSVSLTQIKNIEDSIRHEVSNLKAIKHTDKSSCFLRRHIHDFSYTTIDHIESINVYKVNNNEYLIIGKNKYQKLFQN
ncbi:GNAT family N-acetyltransferase [Flavivirga aquimarina]|uniref:GNAT family N-acetyltransferase n=1 Tax=Flavivirga aquimarina TaxID=2027862 RepID=A0ABT8WDN9_9FLAO|nr:GNAT family N-acetyltransferase [Flavivirga aquimarina]MDO5971142.1 GNAT family N-acetyltransferase [Flavivirga aquimarina]